MTNGVRKSASAIFLPLMLPGLAVLLSTLWLGYTWGDNLGSAQGADSVWTSLLLSSVPPLLLLMLAGLRLYLAVLRVLMPWMALAHIMQTRKPSDTRPVSMPSHVPQEVHAMVQALNRLLERLHEEGQAQQRFVADAAHQLRTPLAALQSQVEAWALTAQAAQSKSISLHSEQVEHLKRASRRTTQLANQLLVLSRVDSGLRQDSEFQRVDLKSLCEALLEAFIDAATKKDLDLGVEIESAHVSGYEWLLRELLTNVLDNAVKYTPRGGKVTLRCGRKAFDSRVSRAFIEVEDDGQGVPVCEYTRLTKRFYRVAGTSSEGTGLGLAIAEEIAIAHNSSLQFDAGENGRGLKVTLIFSE